MGKNENGKKRKNTNKHKKNEFRKKRKINTVIINNRICIIIIKIKRIDIRNNYYVFYFKKLC